MRKKKGYVVQKCPNCKKMMYFVSYSGGESDITIWECESCKIEVINTQVSWTKPHTRMNTFRNFIKRTGYSKAQQIIYKN